MKNQLRRIRNCALLGCFFLLGGVSLSAQTNPCDGDKVGIRAGTGTVEIQRRDCEMILISYDRYFALEVASRQNDSLRSKTLKYMNVVEHNIALRDSLDDLNKGFIQTQDTAITRYKKIIEDQQKLLEDSQKNAEYCERRLWLSKAKTGLYAIGGAIGGTLVGFIVGRSAN